MSKAHDLAAAIFDPSTLYEKLVGQAGGGVGLGGAGFGYLGGPAGMLGADGTDPAGEYFDPKQYFSLTQWFDPSDYFDADAMLDGIVGDLAQRYAGEKGGS